MKPHRHNNLNNPKQQMCQYEKIHKTPAKDRIQYTKDIPNIHKIKENSGAGIHLNDLISLFIIVAKLGEKAY